MSIVLASKNGKIDANIREYFVDNIEEIKDLPTNIKNEDGFICTGSSAYVVNGGNVFLYSETENKWIEQ